MEKRAGKMNDSIFIERNQKPEVKNITTNRERIKHYDEQRKGSKHISEVDTTLEKIKGKKFKLQEQSIEKSRNDKYE